MIAAGLRRLSRRLSVQAWMVVTVAVFAAVVLTAVVVGTALMRQSVQGSDRLLRQTQPAQVETQRMADALTARQSGVWGYVLTGDAWFRGQEQDSRALFERADARLTELLGDGLAEDRAQVTERVRVWSEEVAVPLMDEPDRVAEPADMERGRELFARADGAIDDLDAALSERERRQIDDLNGLRTVRNQTLIGFAVALVGIAGVLTFLARAVVAQPLARLAATTRRVAAGGDYDRQLSVDGPVDVRMLAADIEAMRRRIVTDLVGTQADRQRLRELAGELDAQAAELRRSNAELEQFAYVASHDLQEPLRKVASFCQLLERRYGAELDDRAREYIDHAVDGARRMQVMIEDLLRFSRIGHSGENRRRVSLDATVDDALSNLETALTASGAEIERPASLPEIVGDHTLLTLLWQNLIGNAIKFAAPDRPLRIRIDHAPAAPPDGPPAGDGHQETAQDPQPDLWRFSVTDTGIGIDPAFADRVFTIFQRLHGRDAYGGTGIGLSLCRKVVTYHGGDIWVETEPGRRPEVGTRVSFTLSADAPHPPADRTASQGDL